MDAEIQENHNIIARYRWMITRELKHYEAELLDARSRLGDLNEAIAALEALIRLEQDQPGITGKPIRTMDVALAALQDESRTQAEHLHMTKHRFEQYTAIRMSLEDLL